MYRYLRSPRGEFSSTAEMGRFLGDFLGDTMLYKHLLIELFLEEFAIFDKIDCFWKSTGEKTESEVSVKSKAKILKFYYF